ncbi:MAG: T9SS type A sorting domain-containing protein [Ignavibacteria bacterium]|nr:T9SS type A sorting domain-containing protein [Ignavibacteria bacterium]
MIGKATVFFTLILLILSPLNAGSNRGPAFEALPNLNGSEISSMPVYRGNYPSSYSLGAGDSIGFTTYDYGSNGSALKNLVNFGDGAISFARMGATVLDPGTADRGTWFSHSTDTGSTWPSFAKVEISRTGWGSIDQFADVGGVEVVASHDFGAFAIKTNVDAARGVGIWSEATVGASVWPRIAVTNPFSVHLVASFGGNPPTDISYTRSTDAGATFDIVDQLMFTASPGVLPGADAQDIAAFGTNVAIVNASGVSLSGGDVGLMTSADDGTTWAEQVIYDVAGAGELPTGSEEFQPDGSCAAVYDNNGVLHVVWSTFLAVGNATNDPELFYSVDAPIMYWSEATGVIPIAYPLPDTSIGLPNGRNGNYATAPDIGVDAANNLYVVYSSMVNDQDTAGLYYEHLFAVRSYDNGATWTEPLELTPGTGFDASFPSIADLVDDNMHIVYNCDPLAGNSLQGDHVQIPVAVMYLQSPAIVTGVTPHDNGLPEAFRLEQNYPNPFNPGSEIRFRIAQSGPVSLVLYDLLGNEVATLVNEPMTPGEYHRAFDGSQLSSGVYFYRLSSGTNVATRKMLLMK